MIGILSDAHGNVGAFSRAIELLRRLGADRFFYLGDAVGYIPTTAVVTALRQLGSSIICIRGNHEDMLLNNTDSISRDEAYKIRSVRGALADSDRRFLESWPTSYEEDIHGRLCLFIHGSPDDVTSGYVYEDTELAAFKSAANFVFMGHTHRPFLRKHQEVFYVNVGSCGLPRDDGRYGAAVLFDEVTHDVRILRFDITAATKEVLSSPNDVHESVKALFDRRAQSICGEIIS